MDNFEKWDEMFDTEGLQSDIEKAAENGGTGEYKEVPHGKYEVAVEQMELKATKKGDPMVSIWFKIVSDCDVKGSYIFYNQVITQGFQIHMVNQMLRDLLAESDSPSVIEFKTYSQYGQLIMDVQEVIDGNYEYALDYQANSKNPNFNTYKITEVFPLD